MLEIFKSIKLDDIKYKNKCFYRLQQLEHLLNTNQISDNLRWNLNLKMSFKIYTHHY